MVSYAVAGAAMSGKPMSRNFNGLRRCAGIVMGAPIEAQDHRHDLLYFAANSGSRESSNTTQEPEFPEVLPRG